MPPMGRLNPTLRAMVVVAAIATVVGAYIAFKAYHQMHTPLPLHVIQEGS